MLRRRATRDEGFTLIELLLTISIIGIILVALTATVFAYLRSSQETSARLNESSDQQFVSAYWQQDVSSLGLHDAPSGGAIPNYQSVWVGSSPNCAVSGTPVVSFSWRDYNGVSTTDATLAWTQATLSTAAYYTTTSGAQTILHRKRCGTQSSDNILAHYLTAAPIVACQDTAGASASCTGTSPFPATVSITLVVRDLGQAVHTSSGYTTTLTAERRQG